MKPSTYKFPFTATGSWLRIPLIFREKGVTLKILPWGTRSSWRKKSESTDPTQIWKRLKDKKKKLINIRRFPHKFRLKRSRKIPCLKVLPYIFLMSKNMHTKGFCLKKRLHIFACSARILSIIDCPSWNQLYHEEIKLFVSKI